VIVDKNSAMGIVVITERGYTVEQADTGQDVYMDQYTELTLSDGQACVIHGSSTVLYYKVEPQTSVQSQEKWNPPPGTALPSQAPQTSQPYTGEDAQRDQPLIPPPTTEIKFRIQIDNQGHFSASHPFSVLYTSDDVDYFFSWFGKHTSHRPRRLRFTLKDAMPDAKVYQIVNGHSQAFQQMRGEVLRESEKAKGFMPDLKEFWLLVADPEWREGMEDERWCDIVPKVS
jgi:hypothetical protein